MDRTAQDLSNIQSQHMFLCRSLLARDVIKPRHLQGNNALVYISVGTRARCMHRCRAMRLPSRGGITLPTFTLQRSDSILLRPNARTRTQYTPVHSSLHGMDSHLCDRSATPMHARSTSVHQNHQPLNHHIDRKRQPVAKSRRQARACAGGLCSQDGSLSFHRPPRIEPPLMARAFTSWWRGRWQRPRPWRRAAWHEPRQ